MGVGLNHLQITKRILILSETVEQEEKTRPLKARMLKKANNSETKKLDLSSDFKPSDDADWRRAAGALLKGASFKKTLLTDTYEAIQLKPIYQPEDLKQFNHPDTWPGLPPCVRGCRAAGYVGKAWDIAQEASQPSAKALNAALKHDLANGQTVINIVLDAPGRRGMDSDAWTADQASAGGLALAVLADVRAALAGIDLAAGGLFVQAGVSGLPVAAFLTALCQERRTPLKRLTGCIGFDPLGELAATGVLPRSLEATFSDMALLTRWAKETAPALQTILADGRPYHNAGASAVQELACVLATGVAYIRGLQDQNQELTIDDIAPRMRFSFALGCNFFMEIARLRAARMLWSQVVKEFGGSTASQKMTIHASTSRYHQTVLDPHVNVLRGSTAALAGILGGCDSLQVEPFDSPLRAPDDFSRRIARNAQIILREESHLDRVIDPGGGSWFIESLTLQVAEKSWELFQEIERKGGMPQALTAGLPQSFIAETARQRRQNIERRRDRVVGTNVYPDSNNEIAPENDCEQMQSFYADRKRSLEEFKASRPRAKLTALLATISTGGGNPVAQMGALAAAAGAGATLAELQHALHPGTDDDVAVLPLEIHRAAMPFEELRTAMGAHRRKTGSTLRVFLASIGPVSQHKERADFAEEFFQVAGFEMMSHAGFTDTKQAARAALASGAQVVVICSTAESYLEIVPPLAKTIKAENPGICVFVAGLPEANVEMLQQAGVDQFIYPGCNAYAILKRLVEKFA